MPQKIGIICASDTELAPFLAALPDAAQTKKAMLTFYEGSLCGHEAVALYSGVCKVNAAAAAQLLIDMFGAQVIINAGVAGGMAPHIHLFDVVVGERAVYHDVAEDILTDFHPWLPENCFHAGEGLLAAAHSYAESAPFPVHFGTIATGEAFIEDDRRADINARFAPLCVDMETAAIAHVCHVNGVPFLSVRSITDTDEYVGADFFELNVEKASAVSAQAVMGILPLLA